VLTLAAELFIAKVSQAITAGSVAAAAEQRSAACSMCLEVRKSRSNSDRPSGINQDAFARFRNTICFARSMKARKLAAMWRRPG